MRAQDRRVSGVMQTEVVSLGPEDRLDLADDIMRLGRIRHMPVLDGGRLVGIVSNRDVLAASLSKALDFDPQQRRSFMRSVNVSETMTRDVVTLGARATLRQAAELLVERQIGCLPVVEPDGTFLGLLTETDLVRATLLGEASPPAPAASVLRVQEELAELRQVRDQLRVHLPGTGPEGKGVWEELERKLAEAEDQAKLAARLSGPPLRKIEEAVKKLLTELRDGYRQVRERL